MVTPPSIPSDESVKVTQITPVDLAKVRDPGMRALTLLAASLGWNVIQKVNQPIVLVARNGTQRRLPTNTSVRMSVFQAALSTIMVHTEDREATPELVDLIVRETKLDREHQRRLRLAIGETTEEHRTRLANERAAEQKRQPDEHLTQTPVMPATEELVSLEPPVDGENHGALMSRKPFMARHQTYRDKSHTYESDASFERVWQDGFKDYECRFCGRVFRHPKGAGAHQQIHTKSGEIPRRTQRAFQRAGTVAIESEVPAVADLVFEKPPEESAPAAEVPADWLVKDLPIVDQIAALVSPSIIASRDMWKQVAKDHEQTIDALQQELGDKTAELEKLRADWDALRGLIDGR
jgi:hypothetical protein